MLGNQLHLIGCLALSAFAAALPAQTAAPAGHQPVNLPEPPSASMPTELEGVGIDEHLDMQLPLDARFTDEQGTSVRLGEYFDGKRPVILTLVYYGCPMLCGLVSNAQMETMKQIEGWTPGQQYRAVTVSFDPRETPELARLKKQNYIKAYGNPAAAEGWHFLTGQKDSIDALTTRAGFRYRWDDKQQQFAHVAVIMIATPDGRLSRYLHGTKYDPKVLRLSLVEASEGKIGTTTDHVLLYCFKYDPSHGVYTIAARNLMSAAGAVMVLAMLAWLVPVWVKGYRREKRVSV